jgi:hypothetical protein
MEHTGPNTEWNKALESTTPCYMPPESTDLQGLEEDTAGISKSPNGLLRHPNNNDADSAPVLGGSPVETNDTEETTLPDHASEKQQEWIQRFNSSQSITELDHLLRYMEEAKANSGT